MTVFNIISPRSRHNGNATRLTCNTVSHSRTYLNDATTNTLAATDAASLLACGEYPRRTYPKKESESKQRRGTEPPEILLSSTAPFFRRHSYSVVCASRYLTLEEVVRLTVECI